MGLWRAIAGPSTAENTRILVADTGVSMKIAKTNARERYKKLRQYFLLKRPPNIPEAKHPIILKRPITARAQAPKLAENPLSTIYAGRWVATKAT